MKKILMSDTFDVILSIVSLAVAAYGLSQGDVVLPTAIVAITFYRWGMRKGHSLA